MDKDVSVLEPGQGIGGALLAPKIRTLSSGRPVYRRSGEEPGDLNL